MQGGFVKVVLRLLAVAFAAQAPAEEVVTFEGLARGMVVDQVFTDLGAGPVVVTGANPRFQAGTQAAIIFDSSRPTSEDYDLGSPSELCREPGPGIGWGGGPNREYPNCAPRGNVLIIAEDLVDVDPADGLIDDPDDEVGGGVLIFDFSKFGTIVARSLTIMDGNHDDGRSLERNGRVEDSGTVELLGIDDVPLSTMPLPNVGDNGVGVVDLGDVPGVVKIQLKLTSVGAIDDIVFLPGQERGTEGCTVSFWSAVVSPDDPSRNSIGLSFWQASGLLPGDSYNATFGTGMEPDKTLIEALQSPGNGMESLARESVAALLNALQPEVNYALSAPEVLALVQHASNAAAVTKTATLLHNFNDQPSGYSGLGCPLMDSYARSIRHDLPRRRQLRGR